jgi:hypothetical protein
MKTSTLRWNGKTERIKSPKILWCTGIGNYGKMPLEISTI